MTFDLVVPTLGRDSLPRLLDALASGAGPLAPEACSSTGKPSAGGVSESSMSVLAPTAVP